MQLPNPSGSLLTRIFLPASAVVAGLFYWVLFAHDNAATRIDLSGYPAGPVAGVVHGTERCWSDRGKVIVGGWVARRGHGAIRRDVRVVLLDAAGRAYALSTRLVQRDDISALLNRRFGDRIQYRDAGFAASVDLAALGRRIRGGRFLIAYDDAAVHVLLPLACRLRGPR